MGKALLAAVAGAALLTGAGTANAAFTLDITTHYQFGCPGDNHGPCGAPDTSFVTFTDSGSTSFSGTLGVNAVSGFGVDFSTSFGGVTLNPGDHFTMSFSDEASNQGGFGGAFGTTQTGATIFANGVFGGSAVNLSVNDADVHSGVPRVNPFGATVDSYVLQGGDPLGQDTGDGFEVSQADGHFTFQSAAVPEPGAWAMMLVGFGALGAAMRRRAALA
jgi:hypothetical protein